MYRPALFFLAAFFSAGAGAQEGIRVRADYPGGNVVVGRIEGDTVHVSPDLRGGKPWFYWSFEVATDRDRTLEFVLPGAPVKCLGMQGPAVSIDLGKTWNWLGPSPSGDLSFTYALKKDAPVRFSVTLPYLQSDLDRFLEGASSNPHLAVSVLAKTRKGRPVELLQIGRPGDGRRTVLVTARHHACEAMASFLLEGFLRAAMSDSEAGRAFRERYALLAVPIVDKDGVEDGDQGKNRLPHDHNRDYVENPLYPEVRAIMELGRTREIRFVVDFHCPTLWMDYHQVIYFPGPKDRPKNNHRNVTLFADLLKKELPEEAPRGCLVLLKSERTGSHFSDHFSQKKGMAMAVTLEFPYAPKGKAMDGASCVGYGEALLRAWNRAGFVED